MDLQTSQRVKGIVLGFCGALLIMAGVFGCVAHIILLGSTIALSGGELGYLLLCRIVSGYVALVVAGFLMQRGSGTTLPIGKNHWLLLAFLLIFVALVLLVFVPYGIQPLQRI